MNKVGNWWQLKVDQESLFRTAVLLSVFFHVLLFASFYFKNLFGSRNAISPIEIDLTKPFRIGGNPFLKPGGGTTPKPIKREAAPGLLEEKVPEKKSPPKDWVLPSPQTKEVEKPVAESVPKENQSAHGVQGGTGEGYQGTGEGLGGGEGEGGGIALARFPQWLNRKEILKFLRKNYPMIEREAGRGGEVVLDLHLDAQGEVTAADVVCSAGAAFDSVAQLAAKKMRFAPALVQAGPVAVKIRHRIVFRLEDEE